MPTLSLHLMWPAKVVVEIRNITLAPIDGLYPVSVEGNLVVENMFNCNHRVPDVDRYHVTRTDRGHSLVPHQEKSESLKCSKFIDVHPEISDGRNIIMLLESPHKEEYCYGRDGPLPIAPAQGRTGYAIRDYLPRYFDSSPSEAVPDCDYMSRCSNGSHLILCNPVQFQASLFAAGVVLTSESKDQVWTKLWNVPGVREDFLQRLLSYNPHIIINACTKKGRGTLRTYFAAKSHCFPTPCYVYEASHPSSPHFIRRTGFRFIGCLGNRDQTDTLLSR